MAPNSDAVYPDSMSDYNDNLESLDEQEEREYREDARYGMLSSTDDDLEGDAWAERFGVSYFEDRYDVDDIDDTELERLEAEFFDPHAVERGGYGTLEEIEDDQL